MKFGLFKKKLFKKTFILFTIFLQNLILDTQMDIRHGHTIIVDSKNKALFSKCEFGQ